MALSFITDFNFIYPLYNDAFIRFKAQGVASRAEITIQSHEDIFPAPFVIYPNASGVFLFNLKEVAKATFEEDRFSMPETLSSGWISSMNNHKTSMTVNFNVITSTGSEEDTRQYTFFRGVYQPGVYNSPKLLTSSETLDFIKGWPLNFQLFDLKASDKIKFKHLGTSDESDVLTVPTSHDDKKQAVNIQIGNSGDNWSLSGFLPILDLLNPVDIYVNDVFYSSFKIRQCSQNCGVYLRWLNNHGGTEHHLFDSAFRLAFSSKLEGQVYENSFLNVGETSSPMVDVARTGSGSYSLKTSVRKDQRNKIKSLFFSPKIEVYSETEAYKEGFWLPVSVEGGFAFDSKKNEQEISVRVDLPELLTAKL